MQQLLCSMQLLLFSMQQLLFSMQLLLFTSFTVSIMEVQKEIFLKSRFADVYQNTEDCAADHAVAIFTIQLQSSTPKF